MPIETITDQQTLTADRVIDADTLLEFAWGGRLTIPEGYTLTINSFFTAPRWPIFDGPGRVIFRKGVTPHFNLAWYGAGGAGEGTDHAALNKALQVATVNRLPAYLPQGHYVIREPLFAGYDQGSQVKGPPEIYGDGRGASVILAQTTGMPALDLMGALNLNMHDFGIWSNVPDQAASVAVLMGRADVSGVAIGGARHRLTDLQLTGFYTVAPVYAVASEENVYTRVEISINAGLACYVCSNWNVYTVQGSTWPFGSIVSNGGHRWQACRLLHQAPEVAFCLARLDGAADVLMQGCYFDWPGASGGGTAIKMTQRGQHYQIEGCLFHGHGHDYWLDIDLDPEQTLKDLALLRPRGEPNMQAVYVSQASDLRGNNVLEAPSLVIEGAYQGRVYMPSAAAGGFISLIDPASFSGVVFETDTGLTKRAGDLI